MDAVKQMIIVICGIKNSGKTTLIRKLIPGLNALGFKVATIKHDGHEFESDVPGTDSYYHQKAGAYGTAVFSKNQFMITKKQERVTPEQLAGFFPEADLILIEGCKESSYPKIEVIRSVNGNAPVSNPQGRFLIVSDCEAMLNLKDAPGLDGQERYTGFNEINVILDAVVEQIEIEKTK